MNDQSRLHSYMKNRRDQCHIINTYNVISLTLQKTKTRTLSIVLPLTARPLHLKENNRKWNRHEKIDEKYKLIFDDNDFV